MEIYGSLPLQRINIVLDSVFKIGSILLFEKDSKWKVIKVDESSFYPNHLLEEYDPNYFQNSINHFKFLVKYNLVV